MKLYAVISTEIIEEYYYVEKISSIHLTEKEAWDFISDDMVDQYYSNLSKYFKNESYRSAYNHYSTELRDFDKRISELKEPKFYGNCKDKEALALHHQKKKLYKDTVDYIYDEKAEFQKSFVDPLSETYEKELLSKDLTEDDHMKIMYYEYSDKIPQKVKEIETGAYCHQ